MLEPGLEDACVEDLSDAIFPRRRLLEERFSLVAQATTS